MCSSEIRELDFIIIGVQKGGTTSLWEWLRAHPEIAMPNAKEAPIFFLAPEQIPEALEMLVGRAIDGRSGELRVGKAATQYMMGINGTAVEVVAERIARSLPGVRLIALLRDPIDRAISHYRMSVRRGFEARPFDAVVEELLEPENLEVARSCATETNSYLVQGEYARILQHYRQRIPDEQIHIESTEDLDREPGLVLDRVLAFLGLPGEYRPEDLGVRYHVGGTQRRLDGEELAQLRAYLDEHVWSKLGDQRKLAKFEFNSFLTLWNVIPDSRRPALSEVNRRRLEVHYRADARALPSMGVRAPWLASWKS
ncbi:MAG TPA: sulfotransferase domain-containing protein [Solirubrobacterales bacterium]|nr:sulfotransferase domain-containing protein [Solirubrobacterales bacterium]